nr:PKD domain-containing protein [Allomuricauda sp.]
MKLLLNRAKIVCLMILAMSYLGCEEDDEGGSLPEVLAGFTQLTTEGTGTVSFINTSENADKYEWDFGDGTTSTEIDPIKTYVTGTYTVSLTASNAAGGSDTFEDELVIVVPEAVALPITFDGANVDYDASTFNGAAFEVVDNPAPGGSNDTASKVGAITNSGAAFEGFFFDLGTPIDLSTDKTIQMNFWADAAIDVLLKLEEGTGAATEITASHGGSGWEMLSFDFTSGDSFSRFTMFVDGPGTTAGTFYIDDITQVETMTGGGGTAPTTSAPVPPARDAADVISIYGGTYTNIDGINYNPDWGQSGLAFVNTEYDPGDGNFALAYPTFNYQGTDFSGNPQDASGMEFLHIDIWVPTGTDRQVKVSPINGGTGTGVAEFLVEVPLTPGAWNSVDLPIGDFTGMTWDEVVQLKFDGQFNGDGSANTDPHDIYLDNIYFYKEASGGGNAPTTSAPVPPARDAADVISIFGETYTNVTGIDYDPNWGQSGFGLVNPAFDPGDGNLALAYPTFNYQGTDFSGNAQDASTMEFLHVDIWVPSGTDRQVKISPINGGAGTGVAEFLVEVPLTPGSWNSVDLPIGDFTGMTWDDVVQMKFDGQFNGDGSANTDPYDIYLDNIYFYKEPSSGGNAPTTSAPVPPARDAADVISIYGGTYTNVTGIDYDPNWGQSGFGLVNTAFDPGDGNLALAYPTFNYQGTDFSGNAQDASAMEFLHIDIWVPSGTDRQVKVSPINSGTGAGEVLVEVPLTPGAWNSVDLPIGDFTGMTWDSVIQMKFDGQFNGDGSANTDPHDIYLDNIYFYKAPSGGGTAPTTSAPVPPARDAADVISIYGGTYTNISGIDYDPNWGQSGFGLVNPSFDPGDGNLTLAYPTFNYQGTDFSGNAQDASAMEFIHVDIWVPSGTDRQVKISPINSGTGAGEVLVVVPVTPGSWNSVDLPIGDFTGMTWDSVIQMKFDGQFNGDGSANTDPHDIYLDNIYFYRTSGGGGGGGCPAPPTGELLSNGGFEANSGDGACWQLNDGGGAVTIIDTDANTGTYSVRLTSGPAQVPNIKQERFATSIAGSQGVQVEFRYKINTSFVDGAILQVLAFSEFTTNPAVAHDLGNAADVTTTGVWQTYTGTFTTDASIEEGISLLIQATCGGAGTCAGEVIIDDVVVTEI